MIIAIKGLIFLNYININYAFQLFPSSYLIIIRNILFKSYFKPRMCFYRWCFLIFNFRLSWDFQTVASHKISRYDTNYRANALNLHQCRTMSSDISKKTHGLSNLLSFFSNFHITRHARERPFAIARPNRQECLDRALRPLPRSLRSRCIYRDSLSSV